MTVVFNSTSPVFASPNVARTARWYQDVLGFKISLHGSAPKYQFAMVARDGVELMFRCVSLWTWWRCKPIDDWDIYVRVTDVSAIHRELQSKGVPIVEALTEKEYKQLEFTIADVDGRRVVFATPTG